MSEGDRWSMPDSGLWIYPDLWWEEVRLDVSSENWGEKGGDEMQPGRLSVQDSEKLGAPGSGGRGGVPAQQCCCLKWFSFILARCCVCYCFVIYLAKRPCLRIEVHYTPPRTRSCLTDCLSGICWGFSIEADCLISHQRSFTELIAKFNDRTLLMILSVVMKLNICKA